ncbi:GNAT family N-acetyltransferase [Microbacterium sp. SSM24]|uniref:GNAT family N-acetyltransferase n=1 Tax=Microbacterium sp. SSM24 TaxID=2991714 RepID=UPI002227B234|nr:GNAT family protein [Microbacterium sp. SSM24]MCW3494465.1 GNAT family N-acetyltransferase [Microbacterium sp. SSM24]
MSSEQLIRLWPAAGVRVRSGGLELRWIDDELLGELADLAGRGIHSPDTLPFEHAWTRGTPDEVARSVVRFQWNARPQVSPDRFVLELGVIADGVPVGVQGLVADDWGVLRCVRTGSWLGQEHQGRGIGRRMRVLALHLAFEGLGAVEARTGAFVDNAASNAVSHRVGYLPDGAVRVARDGEPVLHNNFMMTRERWSELRDAHAAVLGAPVELHGVAGFRAQIGADGS